jgi:predicted DNA-binding transcriptional regulator AlpA
VTPRGAALDRVGRALIAFGEALRDLAVVDAPEPRRVEVTVQAPAGGPSRLLRPAEVLPLVGRRSLSSLARLRREDETFPAPVRVPGTRRAIAWREADVVAWQAARNAAQD